MSLAREMIAGKPLWRSLARGRYAASSPSRRAAQGCRHEKRKGPGKPLEGCRALVQYALYAEV
jgi:hypothetical protein